MIDLSTTTARALRHLVTIGMTQSTVEKYSYSGFGYIVRHFEEIGISYVTPDMIYAYADTEMKRASIEKAELISESHNKTRPIWIDNEEMIMKLSGLL